VPPTAFNDRRGERAAVVTCGEVLVDPGAAAAPLAVVAALDAQPAALGRVFRVKWLIAGVSSEVSGTKRGRPASVGTTNR
jgi:hypothetical protein